MDPEELYLRVREKEGRLYPDHIVARLPAYPDNQPLSREWRSRADSCSRLTRYLAKHSRPLSILELGCGNGWLANQLSKITAARVWGLDRFSLELQQAAHVFSRAGLVFLTANIFQSPFAPQSFDVIVLASVIQYFPDLEALVLSLKPLLRHQGEIHLLDSPLYRVDDLPAARQRTSQYYASIGFPDMAEYYYHHAITALAEYSPQWLYQPDKLGTHLHRLVGRDPSPFPWLVIR